MTVRLFCNHVYARLSARCAAEKRADLDRDLYAPLEGWDVAETRFWANLAAAAEDDD